MHYSTLVAVLLLAGYVCGDAGAPTPAAVVPAAEATAVVADRSAADWASVLGCMFTDDVGVCLQQRTMRAMKKWLESERQKTEEIVALAKDGDDDEDVTPDKKKGIMDQIGDIFSFGMSRFLQFVDDDDDDDKQDDDDDDDDDDEEKQEDDKEEDEEEEEEEEGRSLAEGRKKKKIKKLKALVKILLVAKLIKEKILLTLAKLGFFLQVKFFVVAVLNLVVNIGRLVFAFLKHKHPQKVIYYEHANHQHHYEHEHHHDYEDAHDDKKLGWFGSLWSRSFGIEDTRKNSPRISILKSQQPHQQSSYVNDYSVHSQQQYPEQYAQSDSAQYSPQYPPDYSAQTQYPQGAQKSQQFGHDLAYSAQKPALRNRIEVHNQDEEY